MQLKLLWNLQELDLSIMELKKNIEEAPSLSGVNEARESIEALEKEHLAQNEQLNVDRKSLKQLEMREQKIVDERNELNESMYEGKIKNVKELTQMQRKMDLLAEEKKKLEEDILLLMESIERQEAEIQVTEEKLKKSKQELQEKENQLESDLDHLNQELAKLEAERGQLAEKIEKKYLDKYLILSQKNQGQGMARVDGDICGGCRVFISAAQRGHLYNPSAMVYCENCGRLLVNLDCQ